MIFLDFLGHFMIFFGFFQDFLWFFWIFYIYDFLRFFHYAPSLSIEMHKVIHTGYHSLMTIDYATWHECYYYAKLRKSKMALYINKGDCVNSSLCQVPTRSRLQNTSKIKSQLILWTLKLLDLMHQVMIICI